MIHAVILAGRANTGTLSQDPATQEALIDIAGKPMILWVIEALQMSRQIHAIVVVAPNEARDVIEKTGAVWVEAVATLEGNVRKGIAGLAAHDGLLLVSGDIPLIRGEMVDSFLDRALALEADVVYPIIDKKTCEDRYPLVKRTYVGLKEGTYTGGNLVFLKKESIPPCLRFLEKVYEARKKPWRLASMLGWRFLIQILLHKARLKELEEKAQQMLGVKARALIVPHPEIGIDVDKPDDLKLARSALR